MKLENMSVNIRQRSQWEAVDLGFSMTRSWYLPIYTTWFAVMIPVIIVLNIGFWYTQNYAWAALLFWWLKPLWDRIPLYSVSRMMFGEVPTTKQLYKNLARLFKGHLFQSLLIYRFDVARSFNLPVWQLEGLRKKQRRNRAGVLKTNSLGAALLLTLAFLHLEILFIIGFGVLMLVMMPQHMSFEMNDIFINVDRTLLIYFNVYFLVVCLLEPIYVACGFTLYINRRTELEAWDIELVFRKLAHKIKQQIKQQIKTPNNRSSWMLVLVFGFMMTPCQQIMADDSVVLQPSHMAKQTIEDVLKGTDFNKTKIRRYWRNKNNHGKAYGKSGWLMLISNIIEFVLWLLLSTVMAVFIYWLWLNRDKLKIKTAAIQPDTSPEIIHKGIKKHNVPLTQAMIDRIWRYWSEKQHRQALSMLYLMVINAIEIQQNKILAPGMTEGEISKLLQQDVYSDAESESIFLQILQIWQSYAYAHQLPSHDTIKQLCQSLSGLQSS